jgi:hypothetical protein
VTVNAAQAAAPAAPARPQQQQPAQRQYQQQQQNQRQGWSNGPPPCRMADKGCKENHQMDKCGMFNKLSAEQKLAVLQEKNLCIFCYKHQTVRDCYAKAKAGYKGCAVGGCGGHHAEELHWVVQAARLFSVHVQPADPEPGTQIFTLRHNIPGGCNIAFDGGSDRTTVTESYAKRMGMQRLSCNTTAVGLGQAAATSGGMYVMMLSDRWGNEHKLEAMAVPHIHTGPAARCPQNLRKRFLRTYMPLSGELHQTGEATDICVGADYPHLQPKHIEKEIGNGQLHVYQSAFGCGYILRGTEPRAAPAANSAGVAVTAAVEVAKAREAIPEPEAALEMEVCAPEAAPAATEAAPSPVAAQEGPPQVEEKEAAPAVVDEILPPSAAPEAEEAAPAATEADLSPMAAQEEPPQVEEAPEEEEAVPEVVNEARPLPAAPEAEEATPAATEASPSPVAAQEGPQQEERVPKKKGAAPAAANINSAPAADPEERKAAPAAADRGLPPMAAPKSKTDPEKMTRRDEAGDQEVDKSLLPAAALRKRRPTFGFWTVVAMLAVTGMHCPDIANGFLAHNCARFASQVDVYPPQGPAACLMTTPDGPASGQAADVADRVGAEMECRALHSDEEKGGGYPIAALEKLVEGRYPPFNPDFLDKNKDGHE